jgi:hypothetical protein
MRRCKLHRSPDVAPDLFARNVRAPRANIIRVYKRAFITAAAATRLKPDKKSGEVEILSRRHFPSAVQCAWY